MSWYTILYWNHGISLEVEHLLCKLKVMDRDLESQGKTYIASPQNMERQRVLIVDDEADMAKVLQKVIQKKCDCDTKLAYSGEEAYNLLKTWHPDVILTDVKMPGLDGLSLLKRTKETDPNISVIIMTGYATIEMAVEAVKQGAYEFFQKPFDNDQLARAISRSLERTKLLRENQQLYACLDGYAPFHGFVGKSPKLKQAVELIQKIADTDATVLIRGESGTGKELAAKALHAMSRRSQKKMITVNCPALPENILESELFGYVKGAFTGATSDKEGLFVAANGSTILLDEIGDIPISIQTKLLRVLQEKEIRALGSTKSYHIDVRVVASTNQDLESKITKGEFREDLYYRLNVVTVYMPSLREIKDDIPAIAQYFLERYTKQYKKDGLSFSSAAVECMLNRNWKGNVRELQNAVRKAVLLCSGDIIEPQDLLAEDNEGEETCCNLTLSSLCKMTYREAKQHLITRFSKAYLSDALRRHEGNVTLAAQKCGMERQAFQRLMRKYQVLSKDFKKK